MPDTFYTRLDFYRLLNAGISDLLQLSKMLRVSTRTLKRWKEIYDPIRFAEGPPMEGVASDPSAHVGAVSADNAAQTAVSPQGEAAHSSGISDRDEILRALRREALDGNVQAAKLLLSEYDGSRSGGEDEVLTIEQAVDLLQEWSSTKDALE